MALLARKKLKYVLKHMMAPCTKRPGMFWNVVWHWKW